ncbi:MAG: 50S ribosomal protein L13 [Anaerolineae bacterium]|nr:50S ribosomal protein L13 [Anaerolineae bacterium]
MKVQIQKTHFTTPDQIERKWYVVDAKDQTLGRLATRIAAILRGKHKPEFVPNLDVGDYVIVLNCDKIHVTGRRLDQKRYWRHSGYPGGIRSVTLREMLERHPERAIEFAVKGMLPKGVLGRQMLGKLRVYAGDTHPHEAQQPEVLEI